EDLTVDVDALPHRSREGLAAREEVRARRDHSPRALPHTEELREVRVVVGQPPVAEWLEARIEVRVVVLRAVPEVPRVVVVALDLRDDPRALQHPAVREPLFDHQLDARSEEHMSELQSRENLVCRLLLEKKK